ncbi:hypothetical protein [Phenylobacterium sp.]|uniref:hypothetical protein n=1 Tax=Phenylobacterium sp. TaxID=1871053 RepID=UPI00286D273A|nr:hypothetical protein [Phenylobacterium sp.]
MQMFQTLARTMGPHETLKLACRPCGRQVEWTRAEAMSRLHPDSTPGDVARQVKCGRCGERTAITVRI